MILTDQKVFGPTPVDYISVDLDYKSLEGRRHNKRGQKSADWPVAPPKRCGWT